MEFVSTIQKDILVNPTLMAFFFLTLKFHVDSIRFKRELEKLTLKSDPGGGVV